MTVNHVDIYTDGACRGNPGPGGYGAVLVFGRHRKEIAGGFANTTNNRMEILACVAALECLKHPCAVTITSDSKYVVEAMTKGWARRWRAKNWMRTVTEKARNADLWGRLLNLCEKHTVRFTWVRGHAGHAENERCDALAVAASRRADLPCDTGYEATPS
ncbi:MAG: ribonuclease HI [Lentisphaeria bacterium]|nr:ribonuclease HI [Lentisphaeria bacterium]